MVTELRQPEEILADLKAFRKHWSLILKKYAQDFKTKPLHTLEWRTNDVIEAAILMEITEQFAAKKDCDVAAIHHFTTSRIMSFSSVVEQSSNRMTNLMERSRLKALVIFLRLLEK